MAEEPPAGRRFRIIPLICASLTIALGLLTFIGWVSGLPLLASVRGKYIPMAPSTALCFSVIGIGLIAHNRKNTLRWIPRAGACVVLVIAIAKLAEIFGGFHFGIDAWFVRSPELFGAVPTGRMAPLTASNFVFIAIALLALTGKEPAKFGGPFGALATVIGALVLVGYWYGTPLLYGGHIIPVALSTACGFFLAGIGVTTAVGADGWPLRTFLGDSTRAVLLRAFVPLITAAALINGWINTTLPSWMHINPAVTSALCAVIFAALIAIFILQISHLVGGRIDRAEAARNIAQAELLALNAHLEIKVQERTAELRAKNQQMEEELQMARELQIALLPQKFPTVPSHVPAHESALRFLSLFPNGDVSGDFFSAFPIGEKAAGIFICDVMGHAVRSALITSMIRGLVEEHGQAAADPGELLTRVNRALALILKQGDTTMFATCFYVVADVERAQLRFANAGHPSALHMHGGNGAAKKLQNSGWPGPAMGIFPTASYVTSSTPMKKGDRVMLFTDGLFEVEDAAGTIFTEEQLHSTVTRYAALPAQEFFDCVINDVRQFSGRKSFDDDVCVVGMEVQHTD
jgi:serine phosphatase RsbU (regulator of sigma subunit)